MTTSEAGTAREVAPGRLAGFEDADDGEVTPVLSLPPRPRRAAAPAPAPRRRAKQAAQASPPTASSTAAAPSAAPTSTDSSEATAGPRKGPKGPEDRVRPSNVHIPVALLEPIEAKCKANGLSHGEVIIVAIEAAYPRLKDLVHPAATAGGSLFASRRSRASRSADGPLTPLNYRLREADFQTLDRLVEEFGASSRGHLITAALNDYFFSS